ncbi:MAG: HAMP domain-containing sensor histidine kinase [Rhodococcus sp. (in: high G+C Gram-positive bacteria)]|jgi:signal transduction histidine kinase|uniref:sensor histidine kinase n=1 Tax=Rhodococcus TaxID=1827 RepID=UPI0004A9455D|nr:MULTISPECIES: HAMP domain-containing sensor histidine kinase [Rhodococcus]ANQ75433.1 hypothetical protein AOT96_30695 [Rhodococcus sp. 008]ARE37685.1 hypothetical protein A0W34_29520 [Rhodococcus sp. BH4]KDQ04985.1 hypothetical protein EN35_17765 [Rhodococcus qingshengii]KSU65421.1 hypothetical protein AS032_32620 [Rhodococcus qingshengii]KZF15140.1 hypothetical protein A2J01_32310 [Rhodococcus sp. EPR-134]
MFRGYDPIAGAAIKPVHWKEPERVIAVLRVLVIGSITVVVAFGTPINRTYLPIAVLGLGFAFTYASYILIADLQGLRQLPQDVVAALDGVASVTLAAATGGAMSHLVAVLPLAIVAIAIRQGIRHAIAGAACVGALFAVVALAIPLPSASMAYRIETAWWWCGYLIMFAVLTGTLRSLLDREHDRAVQARAEALSEHLTIVEERDLRARLLEAQAMRDDGLRIVLHEFRTPISSLSSLANSLATPGRFDTQAQERAISLIAAHSRHLTDMLDSLADVALSTGDPTGVARVRRIALDELAHGSLAAAGISRANSKITITPPGAVVHCDAHRLQRVMTNLLENARRYGADHPVELSLICTPSSLKVEIGDRGPGLTDDEATLVTRKFVSLGERRGTAGLGLWIVAEISSAMGGTFVLVPRPGGGLIARVVIPLDSPPEISARVDPR